MRILCVDLETWSPETLDETGKEKFAPLPQHKPIVACWIKLTTLPEFKASLTLHSGDPCGAWEHTMLQEFAIDAQKAEMCITYNGRGFDLPLLRLRAMARDVLWGWYTDAKRSRYGRNGAVWHYDVADQLTDYGACSRFTLDELAKAMGLPGKVGISGKDVRQAYEDGRLPEIAQYCAEDVFETLLIGLKALCMFEAYERAIVWGETQELLRRIKVRG